MSTYKIPEDEIDNFVSVYWQMLAELEARIDPDKDVLDRRLVEGAYRVLNRSGIFPNAKPRWKHD